MSSVYAVEFDPNKSSNFLADKAILRDTERDFVLERLYALSHGDESRPSIGLTFSAEAKSFGRLIKTWSNNQVR